MSSQPDPLLNPYWHSLLTTHAGVALGDPTQALRFPAEVIPFAGFACPTPEALDILADMMLPGELLWTVSPELPPHTAVEQAQSLPGIQFIYPDQLAPVVACPAEILALTPADAPALVALTDAAFPGFFRPRSQLIGRFFAISDGQQLLAMAGERLALAAHGRLWIEISGVCTRPGHTGQGYAAALITHLLRLHHREGLRSFLSTAQANHRAIALYHRLGFAESYPQPFRQLRRLPL